MDKEEEDAIEKMAQNISDSFPVITNPKENVPQAKSPASRRAAQSTSGKRLKGNVAKGQPSTSGRATTSLPTRRQMTGNVAKGQPSTSGRATTSLPARKQMTGQLPRKKKSSKHQPARSISATVQIEDPSETPLGTQFEIPKDYYGQGLELNMDRQDTKDHACALPGEPKDILLKYIEGGLLVDLRRRIKRTMMISANHPYTKFYAPSISRLEREEHRHLTFHYYMIHPLSMFSFYYETVMFFGFMSMFFAIPYVHMYFRGNQEALRKHYLPWNIMMIVYIITSFCTGYYDAKHNSVVLSARSVAIQYFTKYFVCDFLALVWEYIISYEDDNNAYIRLMSSTVILLDYVRYFRCLRFFHQIRLFFGMSSYVYKTIKLVTNTIVVANVSTFVLYALLHRYPEYIHETIAKHMENTMTALMLVGYGHPIFKQRGDALYPILLIGLGFVLHLILLILGMQIWVKYYSVEYKQTTIYSSTDAYMRYRALPIALRKRIYLYLDFKYQGHFFKEKVIRRITSPALRKEILLSVTKESVSKVELFEKCPESVMSKIMAGLISEIYLPGDIIIKAGSTGYCMFFILAGTGVVTTPDDKELCYLRDGAHFGEVALVINIARVANVIAVTPCELYKLDRRHLNAVIKDHPQILNEINLLAAQRIAQTKKTIETTPTQYKIFSRMHIRRSENMSLETDDERAKEATAGKDDIPLADSKELI